MSPRYSSVSLEVRSGSGTTPSSVPGSPNASTVPSARSTIGSGCPPLATDARVESPPIVKLASATVQNWYASGPSASIVRFSERSSSSGGSSPRIAVARRVCRASEVTAAASAPLPHTSPIVIAHSS